MFAYLEIVLIYCIGKCLIIWLGSFRDGVSGEEGGKVWIKGTECGTVSEDDERREGSEVLQRAARVGGPDHHLLIWK